MTTAWRKPAKTVGALVMIAGLVTHIATGSGAWIIAIGLAIIVIASIERV